MKSIGPPSTALVLVMACFALTALHPVNAQTRVGVIGGMNYAKVAVEPDSGFDFSQRTLYGVGGVISFSLSDRLALQLEPMYLQKGTSVKVAGFGESVKIKAEYIELPVMFKYNLARAATGPYLVAGPYLSYLLSARQKASFIPRGSEDIKDATTSTDYGLGAGIGFSRQAGGSVVFVQGLYIRGLANIDDDNSPSDFTDKIETRGIHVMAGFTVPLGRHGTP